MASKKPTKKLKKGKKLQPSTTLSRLIRSQYYT